MKKKYYLLLGTIIFIILVVIGYKAVSISDDSVGKAVTESNITAEDLTKAALYFKNTSEQTDTNEYDLELVVLVNLKVSQVVSENNLLYSQL